MKTIEIEKFSPCHEALVFRKEYPDFKSAWKACPRGDWMLWIASKLKIKERKLFLAKGLCAKTVIHLMRDQRSIDSVQATIDYGEGKINKKNLAASSYASAASSASAAYAAYAAYAAASSAAASASSAAAYAAAAYAASASSADAASSAAASAASASSADAASSDARVKNQKETADICREILTFEVFKKLKIK